MFPLKQVYNTQIFGVIWDKFALYLTQIKHHNKKNA